MEKKISSTNAAEGEQDRVKREQDTKYLKKEINRLNALLRSQ